MSAQPETSTESLPENILQVGRQPILDRQLHTYGYELLYRDAQGGPSDIDGDKATARTLLYSFLEFGLQNLVGDRHAFINLTRNFFTDMQALPVDKKRIVLEVLETITIDQQMVDGISALHKQGYQIALDDYRFEEHWEPLMPFASIIKVEITDLDLEAYADKISQLKARGIRLLAEKVETHAQYEHALGLGFDYFQGYFFSRPQVLSNRRIDSNQLLLLKILATINDPGCGLEELANIIASDPKMSFKILRFINSVSAGVSEPVKSIHHAVLLVGLNKLRIWASLFVLADMSNGAAELITTSLIRAEICHSISHALNQGDESSAYTVGLLSVLDALLNAPMADIIKQLPLPAEMNAALIDHSGTYGHALNCAIALEKYQWQSEHVQNTLNVSLLTGMLVDAMRHADEFQRSVGK
jgi:EAL and modified HD-GYP domain-containing signal transduction protein